MNDDHLIETQKDFAARYEAALNEMIDTNHRNRMISFLQETVKTQNETIQRMAKTINDLTERLFRK